MPYNDELLFEKDLIDFLQQCCGWRDGVIKNPTEEELIKNWAEILFNKNNDIDHLNGCRLTDGEMRQIISQIEELKSPCKLNTFINSRTVSIIRDNTADETHFNTGKPVTLKIYDRKEIAAGSSVYQIAEQPRFKTTNNVYPDRRGDVMLLINGMPVFHIELKKSGEPLKKALIQIEEYSCNEAFSGIFSLVQVFVAMNPDEAVYFANPGLDGKFNPLYYFHWTDINNDYINRWQEFAHSFLMIPRAHEMIGFYTVPDASDGVLKVLRPYQVYAAENVLNKVSKSHWTKAEQKAGYIWHTTGSGKTLTSFKTAQLVAALSPNVHKVVFLIDRVELDEQSYGDYKNFAYEDEYIHNTSNTDSLINRLVSSGYDEKVFITSIQKMSRVTEDKYPKSIIDTIRRKHIVFIVDECHRDQNGEMHQKIKHTFPKAMFFGYTGTPEHSETEEIFGSELHRYTIAHGIRDHNVLGFDTYEVHIFDDNELRRRVGLSLVHADTEEQAMADELKRDKYLYYLNKGDDKCEMEKIEEDIPVTQYQTDEYRRAVVKDILKNWNVRSYNSLFHAIFATSSIPEAIKYYNLFMDETDNGKCNLKITALFDPSDDNSGSSIMKMEGITKILNDYEKMFGKSYIHAEYSNFKNDIRLRLSHRDYYRNLDKDEQINIVIVVDQLLTGFDSKWINTVYLDKMQKGKNFIQTASRTNRLFGDEKKHGTIFWYRYPHTMTANFKAAVEEYSGNKPFGIFVDKLEKNLNSMNLIFSEISEHFAVVGIENFEKNADDVAWKRMFAKLFSSFKDKLDSAKIQGFCWDKNLYFFDHEDSPQTTVKVHISQKTYFTIVQRYKELFKKRSSDPTPPYDIDPDITDKDMLSCRINNDYMNSRFKQFVKDLNKGNTETKQKNLDELHKSFAHLTQEDQTFARQFLNDVENGLPIEDEKTLSDYIAEYKVNSYNDKIAEISSGLGISQEKLRALINLCPNKLDEYNRYGELFADLDLSKARDFLERKFGETYTKDREVKMKADSFLRDVIRNGV